MRGNEFLNKMELINPAYIEAADIMPKAKKRIWTGWKAAIAACICLVLLAGTAAAAVAVSESGSTWLIDIFTNTRGDSSQRNWGYKIGAEVRRFPVSELSREMQAVGEEIKRQIENCLPESGQNSGIWQKKFSTPEEAWKFVGLDALKKPDQVVGEHCATGVIARGGPGGEVTEITIYTLYSVDDIVLETVAEIYTEYSDNEMGSMTYLTLEDVELTETVYTAASGKQCQIMSYFSPESGNLWMHGHLAAEGIRYMLAVNYAEQDAAQAEELLYQWADMF